MDLFAQMATFVRVVDAGSLSGAARAQRISLAAVSRQLAALEEDLGTTLLVRSTRRLSLTDAGRQWYERSARILREVDDARGAVRDAPAVRGTLVVSAPITLASVLLLPHLPALLERHPALSVDLRLEDHLVDLVGDGVDVALRGGAPPPDTTAFVAHPLLQFRRVVVASPSYLRRRGTPRDPSDLVRHACLAQLRDGGGPAQWILVRGAEERQVMVSGPLRASAPLALRDLCRAGLGVALLPSWLVAEDCEGERLQRVLSAWESPPVSAWALHRAQLRGAPRVRAFLEAVRAPPPAHPAVTPSPAAARTRRRPPPG